MQMDGQVFNPSRQPLLVEQLIKRRMTRQGNIYMFRRSPGLPATQDKHLDEWIHKATQSFDFTPLVLGDQQHARLLAQDYFKHLQTEAQHDRKDWVEIRSRLKQISPFLRRALQTFFVYYDSQVRSS